MPLFGDALQDPSNAAQADLMPVVRYANGKHVLALGDWESWAPKR